MITLNGEPVEIGSFPDRTILMKCPKVAGGRIEWKYESDREFIALIYLVKHLRSAGCPAITLYMPYIPNARMDRVESSDDVFTLKYFSEILNSLELDHITVLDPHSTVSTALINNCHVETPEKYIKMAIDRIPVWTYVNYDHMSFHYEERVMPSLLIFYPDAGAMSRYSKLISGPYAYGLKKRDWETGKIIGLDIIDNGLHLSGKDILIVDDICSKGGTFLHSARKLKELGARDIYLYVSHCENTILEGDLLTSGLIKKVFTTDSIFTKEHEKIEVLK